MKAGPPLTPPARSSVPDAERWMTEALSLAAQAEAEGDVPVGALIIHGNTVVARGMNRREARRDPTWHAEMEVLRAASAELGRWRLTGCTLVVTLEPCAMCAYAAVLARVDEVIYGAVDPRFGAAGSFHDLLGHPGHNHRPALQAGVLGAACAHQLKAFFQRRRQR